MADVVKARHTVTGITVEMPMEQFKAIAFTPLHSAYEVLASDAPVDCIPCGKTVGGDETPDPDEVEVEDIDEYYDDPDKGEDD